MSTNPFADMSAAIKSYDDWPTPEKRADVIESVRRFVSAVDQQAAYIEHMRQTVTPSQQALNDVLSWAAGTPQ